MTTEQKSPESSKPSHGSRNLILLGIVATLIASLTTFVSLKIYHDSGDIYLDRSRPGFLPEKEEAEAEAERHTGDFEFKDSGPLNPEIIDEYLENLKQELNRLNDFSAEPFSPAPLSDKAIGL